MNEKYNSELEAKIDRELKSLPTLTAPSMLVPRVMAVIASRAVAPWYRRAWPTWPLALRVASFAVLLAMFTGLCAAGWQLPHATGATAAAQKIAGAFSVLSLAWKTFGLLGHAGAEVIGHLGTGFILVLGAVMAFGYAACIALGSACYRLAYARR